MQDVQEEFKRRADEVNVFFKFLGQTLRVDARLYLHENRTWRHRPIDITLSKILKSSAYLVLYNLVESVVSLTIRQMHTAMKEAGLTYIAAADDIRQLWLSAQLKDLARGANHDKYLAAARDIAEGVRAGNVIEVPPEYSPVPGNYDAQAIRNLAETYGIRRNSVSSERNSEELKKVKDRRNSLAHGVASFAALSADDTLEDLEETKKAVLKYLRNFIRNARSYMERHGYVDPAAELPRAAGV